MTAHTKKRIVDKEKNNRLRAERARISNFLGHLLDTPTLEGKVAMITNANPYHFLMTPKPTLGKTL